MKLTKHAGGYVRPGQLSVGERETSTREHVYREQILYGTTKGFADFQTYRMEYRPMLTDEQWMWLAQIDSVLSILHHGPKRRDPAEYEEARRWVESREYYIGSFEFVCDLFVGYDSEAMREALLAIVPNGGRRYAARPSGSQCGPRPAVSALTPKSRRKVGYNKPQEVAA